MKHWEIRSFDGNDNNVELAHEDGDRVLFVSKMDNGNIRFTEACDEYFYVEMSKNEAVEAINELCDWIRI